VCIEERLTCRSNCQRRTVHFAGSGHHSYATCDVNEARAIAFQEPPDLIVISHDPPETDGTRVLSMLRAEGFSRDVLMVAETPDLSGAIEAMRLGALDYLAAPVPNEALLAKVANASGADCVLDLSFARATGDFDLLWKHIRKRYGFDHVSSRNPETRACYAAAACVARGDAGIIIEGETGTGKEYLAKAVHYLSDRRDERLVTINCAAIPEALLESELFGHEKGAFTSATARKIGLCEEAHRGTLLLDEIGEMPLALQVKLLRFLQERSFARVGGTQAIEVDVRVIACTNQVLERRVEQGKFREDLYYRLNVLSLRIPPLRNRPEDILPFARHDLRRHKLRCRVEAEDFTPSAEEGLLRHTWPGNLRELDNAIHRACLLADGRHIEPRHLMLPRMKQPTLSFARELVRA